MSRNQIDMMMVAEAPDDARLIKEGMQVAQGVDQARDEAILSGFPEGKYSAGALKSLTKSINKALELFQAPPLDMPTEDIEGVLPLEHARAIMMINAAIEDSGIGESIDIAGLSNDKAIKMAAGRLDAAARDKAFKSYLAKPLSAELDVEEVSMQEVPEGMHSMPDGSLMKDEEMDEEELMMSRMR